MTERQMRRRRVVVRGEGDKVRGDGHQVIPPARFCRQAIQEAATAVSRWPSPEPAAAAPTPCTTLPLSRSEGFTLSRWKRSLQRITQQGLQKPAALGLLRG